MALVLFFVPFGSAFAYTGGLLNGKALIRATDINSYSSEHLGFTDNDVNTGLTIYSAGGNDTVYYKFNNPVNLTDYQVKASNVNSDYRLNFYDSNKTLILSIIPANIDGTKVSRSLTNITFVSIENISSANRSLFEIDVFGTVATPSNDYSGGLLDGKSFTHGDSGTLASKGITSNVTDNNVSTSFTVVGTQPTQALWYDFSQPVDIASYRLKSNSAVNITFVNSSNNVVSSSAIDGSLVNLASVYNDVTRIKVSPKSSAESPVISEFNVYSPDKTYGELSNLTLTSTHNSVSLMWNLPTDKTDFTGTKIYKNGAFLKSVDSSTNTFTDSDVSAESSYTYKITAVYSDGHETPGLSQSVTTKSPPPPDRDGDGIPDSEDQFPDDPTNTPPPVEAGEVKNLEITTTYKSANLSWVLPKSENLQHVNIYRETLTQETSFMDKLINGKTVYAAGEKIFETNGTYFNDYTVEPGTEYEYKVTTTSVDGVESEGVTARTTTPGKPLVDFEEVSLPFSVKDLLLSGNGLLWIIGPFILLALAFLLVPKLRNLILGAFRKDSKASSEADERRTKAEAIQKMERQEEKEFRTAREPKSERVEVAAKPIREPKEINQPRIREPKERIRTAKLTRERIREPRAPRASREPRAPRERTRKPRDRRGIS
ncbi:Fibronectin type III domain [Mycobacterium tuberculosis]|nr:Fibronectin type III domain [Mycobacterium tuberculosis]